MADPGQTHLPPEPILRVPDLAALDADDVQPVFAEIADDEDTQAAGGPESVDRIVVLTPGLVPETVPALTETARRLGFDPGVLHVAHFDDYLPAPPADRGLDGPLGVAGAREHRYDLLPAETRFFRGSEPADDPDDTGPMSFRDHLREWPLEMWIAAGIGLLLAITLPIIRSLF